MISPIWIHQSYSLYYILSDQGTLQFFDLAISHDETRSLPYPSQPLAQGNNKSDSIFWFTGTPELKTIRLIREKPEYQELVGDPAKDVYDAGNDYLVSCKPDFTAGDVQVVWEKVSLIYFFYKTP